MSCSDAGSGGAGPAAGRSAADTAAAERLAGLAQNLGDVLGISGAAHGDLQVVQDVLRDFLGGHALGPGRVPEVGGGAGGDDEAGEGADHTHPVCADLGGQFAAVGVERGLGGGVGSLGALGKSAGDRGDVRTAPEPRSTIPGTRTRSRRTALKRMLRDRTLVTQADVWESGMLRRPSVG
ncbi:hypothetical protein ACE1SV_64850 [Streptomyces sennicomposti]